MRHHVKKKVKEKISFQVLKLFNYQIFYFNLTIFNYPGYFDIFEKSNGINFGKNNRFKKW